MVSERMRNFVPHNLSELGIGELELFKKARVYSHFTAGHTPGIHGACIVDNHDTPVPVGGLWEVLNGGRYHASCNAADS